MTAPRILYVQYTNPAAYPPLEQGAVQLADAGCEVLFLGVDSRAVRAFRLAPHPRIACELFDADPTGGWALKWHFVRFNAWVVARALEYKPDHVYASDIMATPAGWLLSALHVPVIYHEHDRFDPGGASMFMRVCLAARRRLARAAVANVLPNQGRLERLCADTGVTPDRCIRVWNCPSVTFTRSEPPPARPQALRVLFYGSINPLRVPPSVVQALAKVPEVSLRLIGFETGDSIGYGNRLRDDAAALGISERLQILGSVSRHAALFPHADDCDVGLACIPTRSDDANMLAMAGASNKAFEFLARGLPLIVSPLRDWEEMFVAPGYAIACQVENADSVAAAWRWYLADAARRQSMGERGRQRVLAEWNYETQFAPVRRLIVGHP